MRALQLPDNVRTIGEIITRRAALTPDMLALSCNGRKRSYRAIDEASNRLANALLAQGLQSARVGILSRNSDLYAELLFGVAKAGAISIVLNWRLTGTELIDIVADSGPALLIYESEFQDAALAAAATRPGLTTCCVDGGDEEDQEYRRMLAEQPATSPVVDISPDDPAVLIYTGGTTGVAKAVVGTHAKILLARQLELSPQTGEIWFPEDIGLLTTPFFHIAGISSLLGHIYIGMRAVILPAADLDAIIAAIRDDRVTSIVLVPTVIDALLDHPSFPDLDVSAIRMIRYGSAPISEPLLARLLKAFSCDLVQNYGMTEALGSLTALAPADHFPGSPHLRSCGRPLPWVELAIFDPDGAPCPAGAPGEIAVRTPTIMTGYWGRVDATAQAFKDGWYLTGDVGTRDEKGYLTLVDRKKDMIISGGENIFPAEIEAVIAGHPDVGEVAVIGVPHPRWGEAVMAFIAPRPGHDVDAPRMIAHCRERIAGYKIPKAVEILPALPKTAVGKISKPALRALFWSDRARLIS